MTSGNRRRQSGYKLLTNEEIDAALTLHDTNTKTTVAPAAPTKPKGPAYFQVPTGRWWRSLDLAPLKVWLYILEEDFRHRGSPFKVTNTGLRNCNISRGQKTRALRELAERGYVSVEWQTRKSPTVTRVHVRGFKKN